MKLRCTALALALCAGCFHDDPASVEGTVAPRAHVLGGTRLEVAPEEREHMGLAFARPAPAHYAPEVRVYGHVVSDPAARTTLRAPLAGELVAAEEELVLGARVAAGRTLFRLRPRWTPQERADLAARLAAARAELATLAVEEPALRAAFERAQVLNADEKSVSDAELEEARARVEGAAARSRAAQELIDVLGANEARDTGALALVAARGGELIELFARPGETVEAGAELARVEDFTELLLELDLPLGSEGASAASHARVEGTGSAGAELVAERVGFAPHAGAGGMAGVLRFRLPDAGALALRPGRVVTAWLPTGAPARTGLAVPDAAVVRLAGRAFVYVRAGEGELERRALALDRPLRDGWFVDEAWAAGAVPEVVVVGAQSALTFELLGRQGGEEED